MSHLARQNVSPSRTLCLPLHIFFEAFLPHLRRNSLIIPTPFRPVPVTSAVSPEKDESIGCVPFLAVDVNSCLLRGFQMVSLVDLIPSDVLRIDHATMNRAIRIELQVLAFAPPDLFEDLRYVAIVQILTIARLFRRRGGKCRLRGFRRSRGQYLPYPTRIEEDCKEYERCQCCFDV